MKKNILKIIIISILVIIGITSFSFASSTTGGGASGGEQTMFENIIDLLNILWLPFAIIAGKLFTNDLVYGSFFGIDFMLFKMWNFSRVLANYAIGFIFIVSILLFLIGRLKSIWEVLGKITIASILINASWFLLGALLDLSTILLVSVGSLPMHLIGTSATAPIEKIKYCSVIEIDPTGVGKQTGGVKNLTICKDGSVKEMAPDKFFNTMNNMTGPLIFIGSSILNIDKSWNIDISQVKDGTNIKGSSAIRNMLHIVVILIFTVPILLLVIIGIIRVFWLWIYISFTPLMVLDYVFGGKYISAKNKNFKISNVVGLIFQPVLVVMAMGIAVIFLATVQTAFIGGEDGSETKKELGICGEKSLCINNKPVVTMEGNLTKGFMEDLGGAFGYIVITILSFVLMWGMIKLAFHSTEITSSIADSTFKFAENGLKAVPIIPTPAGGVGIGAIGKLLNSRLLKSNFDVKASEQAGKIESAINSFFGIEGTTIGFKTKTTFINNFHETGGDRALQPVLKKFITTIKQENPKVTPYIDSYFQEVVTEFINLNIKRNSHTIHMLEKMGIKDIKKKKQVTAQELFNNQEFSKFLTYLIKNPDALSGAVDLATLYSKTGSTANELTKPIGEIN